MGFRKFYSVVQRIVDYRDQCNRKNNYISCSFSGYSNKWRRSKQSLFIGCSLFKRFVLFIKLAVQRTAFISLVWYCGEFDILSCDAESNWILLTLLKLLFLKIWNYRAFINVLFITMRIKVSFKNKCITFYLYTIVKLKTIQIRKLVTK